MRFFKTLVATALIAAWSTMAVAQSNPGLTKGQGLTAGQWNALFAGKQDYLGAPPLLRTGGTLSGPLITASSTTGNAGFNIPPGVAPTSPNNGDLWVTSSSLFARVNGVTIDLISAPCMICAVTNATNTFTAAQIINLNAAPPDLAQTGTMLQLSQADTVNGSIEVDTYGARTALIGFRANGALAAPTTLIADNEIAAIVARGYDGVSRSSVSAAAVRMFSAGTWSATSHPTYIDFQTAASAATTALTRMRIENDGGITLNGASSFGLGTISSSVSVNAEPSFSIRNASTGTVAFTYFNATNSVGAALFGVTSTGYTGVIGPANRSVVFSGAALSGITVYASGANPVDFYINAALAARVTATGGLSVSSTVVDPGNGVINALNGYRIANVAASGNVLRGNGTNFISAILAFGDLSGSASCAQLPALSGGDITSTAGSCVANLISVVSAGSAGSTTITPVLTWDVKGRITSASFATITPAIGSITGLTANQVAGVISGTTPVGLSVPSCSTSASALLWTSATGFSCNTAVAAPAGSLTGSTLAAGVTASSLTSLGTITTLTATTINAFTLAGTIAGGGNQLNNIIIGTATPLAITGTTITGNTSISSPIHTASGTYTFQSNGSTFAGQITTGQQWEFGANAAPASGPLLTLNQNTATPTASFVGTPSLHMISGDSVIGGIAMDTFANQSFFAPRRANNTQASKTAVAAAATIFSFGAQAYDGTVYSSVASLDFNTVNLQSGSDHSGYMAVRLVAGGSTNLIEKFRLNGSGGLGVGSAVIATDPGNGSIIFSGALQSAGTVPIGNTGTCTATSFSGGATSGKFTAPTCAAGTIILSSMPTVQNGYTCSASDETTTTNTLLQTAQTTSSATFKSTTTNADVVTFSCHGW